MAVPRTVFDALYASHLPTIHAYLLARTRDPDLAQDLAQETFLRAWRNVAELEALDGARQRAWLVAVAHNLVIDRSRRAHTERLTVERVGRAPRPVEPDPADQAELAGDVAVVDQAIATLPERERLILSLQVLGGLTSAEIGELLDEPPGTVRYQLSRARRTLQAALEERPG